VAPSSINSYRFGSENCPAPNRTGRRASRHAPAPACPLAASTRRHYGPRSPRHQRRQLDGATYFWSIEHLSQTTEYNVKAVTSNGITSCVSESGRRHRTGTRTRLQPSRRHRHSRDVRTRGGGEHTIPHWNFCGIFKKWPLPYVVETF